MRHIDWINLRLSNERMRLAAAKTERERELRQVWVAQIEKELAIEQSTRFSDHEPDMTDDELLAALEE